MELHFTNLLIVVAVGFLAPLALGFVPRLQLPAVVLEIVIGDVSTLVHVPIKEVAIDAWHHLVYATSTGIATS